MPAILGPAAQRINADTAGLTHVVEANPGQPVGVIPHEVLHEALPTEFGGLSHLFSDGLPQVSDLVDTAVVKPTSSIVGRLGGLVPSLSGGVPPGPTTNPGGPVQWEPVGGAPAPGMIAPRVEGVPRRFVDSPVFQNVRKWLGF